MSDNVDFRAKKITRDSDKHCVMTKKSIHSEHRATPNACASSSRAAKCVKPTPTEVDRGDTDTFAIITVLSQQQTLKQTK